MSKKLMCKYCHENFNKPGATVCSKCGMHQSWVRGLLTLKTISAIASVTTAAAAIITVIVASRAVVKIMNDPQSDIVAVRLLDLDYQNSSIVLLAANTGSRPAAIGGVDMVLPPEGLAYTSYPSVSMVVSRDGTRLVLPDSSIELVLSGPAGAIPRRPGKASDPLQFQLLVELIHHDGCVSIEQVDFEGVY